MATSLLAVGAGAATSSDLTVVAGTPVTVGLKVTTGAPGIGGGAVAIQLKDDAGNYFNVDTLRAGREAVVLHGPGVYRFLRESNGASVGVFSA